MSLDVTTGKGKTLFALQTHSISRHVYLLEQKELSESR
jgi:hypothetical protein